MKQLIRLSGVAVVGAVLLTGCGQKADNASAPATPAAPADTTAVAPLAPAVTPPPSPTATPAATPAATAPAAAATVASSASSSATDSLASAKTGVADAMTLANAGKYTDALAVLQKKAAEVEANPEAKKLIDSSVAQIKQMMTDAATKATSGSVGDTATKALGVLGK